METTFSFSTDGQEPRLLLYASAREQQGWEVTKVTEVLVDGEKIEWEHGTEPWQVKVLETVSKGSKVTVSAEAEKVGSGPKTGGVKMVAIGNDIYRKAQVVTAEEKGVDMEMAPGSTIELNVDGVHVIAEVKEVFQPPQ